VSSAIASTMAANGAGTSAPAETSSGGNLAASNSVKGNSSLEMKAGLAVGIPLGVLVPQTSLCLIFLCEILTFKQSNCQFTTIRSTPRP
jgi:hypothetical protein